MVWILLDSWTAIAILTGEMKMTKKKTLMATHGACLRLSCVAAATAAILAPAAALAAVPLGAGGQVKLFGDMRVRAETDKSEKQDGTDRNRTRLRYRARLGVAFQPNDNWSARIRLATTSSQNSPHVTFATVGETADLSIGVDTALIAYTGVDNLTLVAGKTPLNFWKQNEVFLDDDIHPEGLAAVYKAGPVTLNAAYAWLTAGTWDNKPDADKTKSVVTYQAVLQGGSGLKYTAALGGATVDDPANVFNATQHTALSAQLKGGAWLAGADYIKSDADADDTAYVVQGRYKIGKAIGLRAYYYHVEGNATLADGLLTQDNFPSAQAAADNFKGIRLQLDYKVDKGTKVDLRLYDSEIITRGIDGQDAKNTRLQLNVNLKF
ncbi:MAG TPA: hypothetical protein ENK51_00525 [Gammaproteobacteria bacterium]|nr:hypothetical protein [Gammaproteobacteria bacterium]